MLRIFISFAMAMFLVFPPINASAQSSKNQATVFAEDGFSIVIPDGWRQIDGGDVMELLFGFRLGSFGPQGLVTAYVSGKELGTSDGFISIQNLGDHVPGGVFGFLKFGESALATTDLQTIEPTQAIEINGMDGAALGFQGQDPNAFAGTERLNWNYVLNARGGYLLIITSAVPDSAAAGVLDGMARSISQ